MTTYRIIRKVKGSTETFRIHWEDRATGISARHNKLASEEAAMLAVEALNRDYGDLFYHWYEIASITGQE